ncbi:MAG: HNH endonuclease [Acidobacteriota bacterium]|nr:MAG: HNH endonuclease [Acidobacteriota bacterium]
MPRPAISASLRQEVIERAKGCCEYCLLHQDYTEAPHEIDHIVALKHRGQTLSENLALACLACNRNKGSDLAAPDPMNRQIVVLFNPRLQSWNEHFELMGAYLLGRTPAGRVTVALLRFNDEVRVQQRQMLIAAGKYPFA